jgi:hypothetical protein
MPIGPNGEKRPADVIGDAVKVMRIATGEETDVLPDDGRDPAAKLAHCHRFARLDSDAAFDRPAARSAEGNRRSWMGCFAAARSG